MVSIIPSPRPPTDCRHPASDAHAYGLLAASKDPSVSFTGTRITKERSQMHSRSEGALHRWDITGDDDISHALLSQPEFAAHAVWVLDNMPALNEFAKSLGARARLTTPTTVVLRTESQPDIVLTLGWAGSRFELMDEAVDADLVLTMRADHRPLVLWGRQPAGLDLVGEGNRELLDTVTGVLWIDANCWPGAASHAR